MEVAMNTMIELDTMAASQIFGGKDEQTAQIVEFIAECIGSIAKMIYLANKLRKFITAPATL
ncbi:MAG: hypothetical protein IKW15_05625 [Bacteroidales bacterium]|nr:hypothetical protein [Bacteroidales bacterium]